MTKNFFLILLLLVAVGFLLNNYLVSSQDKPIPAVTDLPVQEQQLVGVDNQPTGDNQNEMETYTLADVKEHSSASDCWLVIEGKVYDVTAYIKQGIHPGGEAILLGCGSDASELFRNRPNGSGSHSEKAEGYLANFYIGDLE
ncbi:MAG: cytochrome b5 domain-containing protein [Patescibacteria group bacterium]